MGVGLALIIALGSLAPVDAESKPRIGVPKAVFDRAWGPAADCNHYGPKLECYYHTQDIGVIDAQFGDRNRAVQIQIGGYENSGAAKWWTVLTEFLPPKSHKRACKRFPKTTPPTSGAARACLYRRGTHNILVVQVLNGDPGSAVLGFIERDGSFADLTD